MTDNEERPSVWGNEEEAEQPAWNDSEEDSPWSDNTFEHDSDFQQDITEQDDKEEFVEKVPSINIATSSHETKHDEVYAALLASVNKSKSTKKLLLIIGAIVFIIVAVIVVCIIIFKENNNDKQHNTNTLQIESSITTTIHTKPLQSKTTTIIKTTTKTTTTNIITTYTFVKKTIVDKDLTDKSYGIFLGEKYNEIKEIEDFNLSDISTNTYAIYDVDNDGREELILSLTSGPVASYAMYIYNCDVNGNVTEQNITYPHSTFYENGTIKVPISHNQGLAGSFWPYSVEKYDPLKDEYIFLGSVDAWDKSSSAFDGEKPFPDDVDVSSSGFVFYINAEGYEEKIPVDITEYKKWYENWVGNESEIEMDFLDFTEDNIRLLNPDFKAEVTPEYLGEGYINTDSGELNLRSEPSTDSEVYVMIPQYTDISIYNVDSEEWYYTYYDGYGGYISADFVKFGSSSELFTEPTHENENSLIDAPESQQTYENPLIKINVSNTLPIDINSYVSDDTEVLCTYKILDVRYSYTRIVDSDEYNVELYVSGEKTYDKYNDDVNNSVKIIFDVYDSNGEHVGSDSIKTPHLEVGNSFCESLILENSYYNPISFYENETYTITFSEAS